MPSDPLVYFFPYVDTPEYSSRPPRSFVATKEERNLRAVRIIGGVEERLPISDGQLYWRRNKLRDFQEQGTPEDLGREFPLTPDEAFLAGVGNAYFPTAYLQALMEEAPEPVAIVEAGEGTYGGRLEVWETGDDLPEWVGVVIGGDEAEGHNEDDKHDYSEAAGFRDDTREQVFHYIGRPDGEHFAYDLRHLSRHYKRLSDNVEAMLVVERTPLGGTTCNKLL